MSRSELGWSLLFITVIVAFAWWRLSPHPRPLPAPQELSAQEEMPETVSPPEAEPEPASNPTPSAPPIKAPPPHPEKSPKIVAKSGPPKPVPPKKTLLPEAEKPKSIKELLEDRAGILPVPPRTAKRSANISQGGDNAFGYFAGYIIYADNSTKKLRHQHAYGNFRIAIEEYPGDVRDWTQHDGQLKVTNFRGDPHGLVIDLPDGRLLYLKFQTDATVLGYVNPVRVMTGWLLSDATLSASVARVAMIDIQEHNREFPPGRKGAEEWPRVSSLKALTSDLPTDTVEGPQGEK